MATRKFYPDPDDTRERTAGAFVGVAVAVIALLVALWESPGWAIVPASLVTIASAAYYYFKARVVEDLPVMELTEQQFRWRKPSDRTFNAVNLGDVRTIRWTVDTICIVVRSGFEYSVPVKALRLQHAKYAISLLKADLGRFAAA